MAGLDFCRNLLIDLAVARAAGETWSPHLVERIPAITSGLYRCPAAFLLLNYPRLQLPLRLLHERIHHPDDGVAADALQPYLQTPITAGRAYEEACKWLKAVDAARAHGSTFALERNPGTDAEPNTAGRVLRHLMDTNEDAAIQLLELARRSTAPNSLHQLRNLIKKDQEAEAKGLRLRHTLDEDETRLVNALPFRNVVNVIGVPAARRAPPYRGVPTIRPNLIGGSQL